VAAVDVIANHTKCRFVNVYRRPSSSLEDIVYARNMVNYLQRLCTVAWPTVVIGDINCPSIDWLSLSCSSDGVQDIILDFICDYGFEQLTTEPTRGDNILDVVLTNNIFIMSDVRVMPPLGSSDHSCVNFTVGLGLSDKDTHTRAGIHRKYAWDRADYESLSNQLMQIKWDNFMSVNLTVDSIWTSFKSILYDAFDEFVPIRRPVLNKQKKRNYSRKIQRAFSRKTSLWRLCKSQPSNNEPELFS